MTVKIFFRWLARAFTCCLSKKERNINESTDCYLSPVSRHDIQDSGTKTTTTLENVSDERVNIVDNNINKTVDGCEMFEKEVHELGMTEPNITDIEGAAIVEKSKQEEEDMECYLRPVKTRRFKKGTICFFGKKKNSGTITTDNGQCYKFYREDLNLCFDRRLKYPQKVKFVVDDSEPKWAYDVEIIGDPYFQRCYYCLKDDHLGLEDCIQLQIDSYNFYYPYI